MQEIICVLDKSGSMQRTASDAMGGFNKFLEDQRAIGDANLTVVWFSDSFDVAYEGTLSEMKDLKEWPSNGSTALNDAIGKTFAHVKERFTKESPEKVILAILTDGEENASREFTKDAAADLIKHHQDKYGWDVIFLAANQDAWETARGYNILQTNAVSYDSNFTSDGLAQYSATITRSRLNVTTDNNP